MLERGAPREGQKLIDEFAAEDLMQAVGRLADWRRDEQRMRGGMQLEMLVGMGERVMCNQRGYV